MFHFKSLLPSEIQLVVSNLDQVSGSNNDSMTCLGFDSTDRLDHRFRLRKVLESPVLGPQAKQGEAMHLVAEFDFTSIPEINAYLVVYLSPKYRNYQPKERGWNLLTLAQSPQSSGGWIDLEPKLALDPDLHTKMTDFQKDPAKVLFHGAKPGEALNIAAFHANGISYSEARVRDPHFSHLLESARNWFVLFAFREKELLDQETSRILYVCMTEDDFSNKAFGKCQLVFV
ncbi:MAG: hypothetical protein SFY67_02760 [Candidatus Melainabacteria bacterium]|nr:hypothetical protein [Candidatus Melainabacteria bacterium]